MPKKVPQTELDAVFQVVVQFPEGASVDEISGVLEISLPRRTLQRRLAMLVDQARLNIEGRGRGSRYDYPQEKMKLAPTLEG